jgi:hypothetical protein
MAKSHSAVSVRTSSKLVKAYWPEIPDRKLVELCLQGSEDAWAEFLRRYRRLIAGVAARTLRGMGGTPSDRLIEDLFQEGLAKVLANGCRALRELEWRHDVSLLGLLQIIAPA